MSAVMRKGIIIGSFTELPALVSPAQREMDNNTWEESSKMLVF